MDPFTHYFLRTLRVGFIDDGSYDVRELDRAVAVGVAAAEGEPEGALQS